MSVKQLWAPWRMDFIEKKTGPVGCVFCNLVQENDDRKNLILYRDERVFVILNKYPYNNGHLMIVPFRHTADFSALQASEVQDLSVLTQRSVQVLSESYKPEGYNIGMNLGVCGGAGIKDHLHMHVVPRWGGDTNFMPVIGETKAMPEHLSQSYDRLVKHFKKP